MPFQSDRMSKWMNLIEKSAFCFFILTLLLSVRKVFFVFYPTQEAVFNEYTDISVYLSDIALLIFLGILLLRNKSTILSILFWKEMFHVEHLKWLFLSPLPFIVWIGVSSLWSPNVPLSLYTAFKVLEGYILYVLLILYFVPRGTWMTDSKYNLGKMFHVEQIAVNQENVPRGTNLVEDSESSKCSTWNIYRAAMKLFIGLGIVQSIIVLMQSMKQGSLGMTFLKESVFSIDQMGVAKVIFYGNELIRPYGFFPHPNVLAFFLGVTILFTVSYPLLFHKKMFHVEHLWGYRLGLGLQILAFLVVFSKTAILSFFLALVYLISKMFHVEQIAVNQENVPRGTNLVEDSESSKCSTWNKLLSIKKMFHVEQVFWLILLGSLIIALLFSINTYYAFIQPFNERLVLMQGAKEMIEARPWIGLGGGQSVFLMQKFFSEPLAIWQFQPVHNVFLLVWSELGIIGLGLFLYFIVGLLRKLIENVPRGTFIGQKFTVLLSSVYIFTFPILMLDHYVWDIQQGILLFWFLLGVTGSFIIVRSIDKN